MSSQRGTRAQGVKRTLGEGSYQEGVCGWPRSSGRSSGSNSAGELQLWGGREGPAKHTIPRPVTIPRLKAKGRTIAHSTPDTHEQMTL